jgi:putative tryptophan/tyrosine transport system substrate-binding protein
MNPKMNRRTLLLLTLPLISTLYRFAYAQNARPTARIGWLTATTKPASAPFLNTFRQELASLGYVDGQNLVIEERYGGDARDRVPKLTEELSRHPVDVIVTHGPASRLVIQHAAKIPVVYVISADPVEAGIAQSLPRPGGNATGITLMSIELNGKRLELLREFVPAMRKVAILANPDHGGEHLERRDFEQTAQRLGIRVQYLPAHNGAELESALRTISSDAPQGIVVFPDALMNGYRQKIIDAGMAAQIPVVSGWDIFARSGALFTYGPKLAESYRRAAYYVDRILTGTKPADLPIERSSVFEIIVNLRTAKALGLTAPPTILARADEVIE